MRRSPLTLARMGLGLLGACAGSLALPQDAAASGPVERMVQLLSHPSDPNVLVVRYGVASEGYLYSRDGGRSFRAICSQLIDPASEPKLTRISAQVVPSAQPTLLDGSGKVVVAVSGASMYTDDGNGCGWHVDGDFGENLWAYSLQRDPKNTSVLLASVSARNGDDSSAQLMRRTNGRWSLVTSLRPKRAGETTLAGDLLVSDERMYAAVSINSTTSRPAYRVVLVASDDGGATWRETGTLPDSGNTDAVLLGIDPVDPDRLLAVDYADAGPDALIVSTDQGKTFRAYGAVAAASGVAFAPDGRVFVADAGDQDAEGGVWTAPRLGDPLVKIESTDRTDCIGFEPESGKLRVCKAHRFGLMDPATGAFEELTRLDKVQSLVECPEVDVHAECETQLNSGSSWCCTGHYAFTPFCGSYDVTKVGNKSVYCGSSGRQYDIENGRGPAPDVNPDVSAEADGGSPAVNGGRARDAGTRRDAGGGDDDQGATASTGAPRSGGGEGGCAVRTGEPSTSSVGGLLLSLGALLIVLGRRLRRRGR